MSTVTVLCGPERRRRWSPAEKARIVEESLAPEAHVAEVARRHDIHPNLLHLWRRQARTGALALVRAEDVAAGEVQFAAATRFSKAWSVRSCQSARRSLNDSMTCIGWSWPR